MKINFSLISNLIFGSISIYSLWLYQNLVNKYELLKNDFSEKLNTMSIEHMKTMSSLKESLHKIDALNDLLSQNAEKVINVSNDNNEVGVLLVKIAAGVLLTVTVVGLSYYCLGVVSTFIGSASTYPISKFTENAIKHFLNGDTTLPTTFYFTDKGTNIDVLFQKSGNSCFVLFKSGDSGYISLEQLLAKSSELFTNPVVTDAAVQLAMKPDVAAVLAIIDKL